MTIDFSPFFAARVASAPASVFPQYDVPPRYDFDQGMPDPATYPLGELESYAKKVLEKDGLASCGYFGAAGRSEMQYGFLGLRQQIANWIARRDGRTLLDKGVLLANGSSAGLSLIANAFLGPGDGAVVEVTTFPYMRMFMESTGATIFTAPVDEHGLDVDAVALRLKQMQDVGLKPKMIYAIPTFHVPTGVLMPLERRKKLLALAQKWNVLLVEDNCYYEMWYDAPPPPTLFSMDDSGLVIQSDSFSKMLAPGVRTGWVAGAPEAIQALARIRQDLGVGQFITHVLASWMADNKLAPHLDAIRPRYRHKRDAAHAALQKHCAKFVTYRKPEGGIFFWLELAPGIDVAAVRERALQQGVACRPGEKFGSDPDGKGYLRMSFLQVPEEEIERGVAVLGKALADYSK